MTIPGLNMWTFRLTLIKTTPLLLAALGGLHSERSGIANIALEGMMLTSAFFAVVGSYFTGSAAVGLIVGVAAGAFMGFLLGFLSEHFKGDQIIIGVAINLLALGLTGYLLETIFGHPGNTPPVAKLPEITIPFLDNMRYGYLISGFHPLVYVAFLLVPLVYIEIYKTPWGLRLRSLGENPEVADTLGISVEWYRVLAATISGIFAGLGGVALSLGELSLFAERMTSGRGYLALAALIFGKWHPVGVLLTTLFFGFVDAWQEAMQGEFINIPSEFFTMLPYLFSLIVLALFVKKMRPPAAVGKPYVKGRKI